MWQSATVVIEVWALWCCPYTHNSIYAWMCRTITVTFMSCPVSYHQCKHDVYQIIRVCRILQKHVIVMYTLCISEHHELRSSTYVNLKCCNFTAVNNSMTCRRYETPIHDFHVSCLPHKCHKMNHTYVATKCQLYIHLWGVCGSHVMLATIHVSQKPHQKPSLSSIPMYIYSLSTAPDMFNSLTWS